ncbi:C-terminal binding protein [soil metagenome]
MARIVITDCDFGSGDIEAEILGDTVDLAVFQAKTADDVIAAGQGARGLFVQWARIDATILDALPDLRAIVRYGIGLDNIDLDAARERGIAVSNVDDYCIDEVATHAASAIVAASRRLWEYDRAVRAGGWAPSLAPAPLPPEKDPVGIVGLGRIGREVAERVRAWGHPVYYWDPVLPADAGMDGAERIDTLVELAETVTHLTLHVPLLDQTRGLIDATVLAALGGEGHLVNVSRGPLVDEPALLAALDSGAIARASLDVLVEEPPAVGSISRRIAEHERVLVTPHMAYLSTKALLTLREHAATRMLELIR